MLDTDTTYGIAPRPSAMGDLRFAGTIAAGLVAGTLGLGALAAPLVGWKDWPSALTSDASSAKVTLASPKADAVPRASRGGGGRDGGGGAPAPRAETPLSIFAGPAGTIGSGGTAGPTGPGAGFGGIAVALGGGSGSSTTDVAADRGKLDPRGSSAATISGEATGTANFGTAQPFTTIDEGDDDNDGLKNDYEKVNGLNKDNPADATVAKQGTGLSPLTEYKIKSAGLFVDTNGDGKIDDQDDSDGDGVSNGTEERNGSDPTMADTDGDGTPDGMDDRNGDGYPDGLPVPTTPEPVVDAPVEEPVVVSPPVETPPADDDSTRRYSSGSL